MIIYWYGQKCFKLEGEKSSLIIDPLGKESSLRMPRLNADIIAFSQPEQRDAAKEAKNQSGEPAFVIADPGEYEIKNIFVYGIAVETEKGQNVIYRIEIQDIAIAHLGGLTAPLKNGELEKIEGVDALLLPVGGGDSLDGKQAAAVISQIEPRLVIPMNYKVKGDASKLAPLDAFCKEIGICPTETLNKYKIAKKDLPQEDMKVVVLEP